MWRNLGETKRTSVPTVTALICGPQASFIWSPSSVNKCGMNEWVHFQLVSRKSLLLMDMGPQEVDFEFQVLNQ